MLTIPHGPRLTQWAREMSGNCLESQTVREGIYRTQMQLYRSGTASRRAAIYNLIRPFVDRLYGYLYSARDIRFFLEYPYSERPDILDRAEVASMILSRDFRESDSDMVFGTALFDGVVKGCGIVKVLGDPPHFKATVVGPEYFGVLREDIDDIEEQDAVCHVSYPTVDFVRDMLAGRRDASEILAQLQASHEAENLPDGDGAAHPIFIGAPSPITMAGSPASAGGIVQIESAAGTTISSRVNRRIVELRELWVRDRDRNGRWTTIQMVGDIVIEGMHSRRNLSLAPDFANADTPLQDRTPFIKVQPYPVQGSFFGEGIIGRVQMLQEAVSKRLRNIVRVADLQAKPPTGFAGYQGVTEEVYDKLMTKGGMIRSDTPSAKIQPFAPQLPNDQWEAIQMFLRLADQAGSMPAVMRGEGESGVRAQGHAETLVRTGSPPLLSPIERTARQLSNLGLLCFQFLQMDDGRPYQTESGVEFRLSEMPDGYRVTVDAASASPAFAASQEQMIFALLERGVLSGEDALRLLHLPMSDILVVHLRERAKAMQAQREQEMAAGMKPKEEKKR